MSVSELFTTSEPSTSINDSLLFEKLIQDSIFNNISVIGCGQSTHGSHENFKLQIALFQHLVKTQGCRIFVLESNYASTLVVNDYVHNLGGSKDSVLNSLGFWTWDCEEMWSLIQWIRDFNSAHPNDQILFLGSDMQIVRVAAIGVSNYFLKYFNGEEDLVGRILSPLVKDSTNYYSSRDSEISTKYESKLATLDSLAQMVMEPTDLNERKQYLLAKRTITTLKQAIQATTVEYFGGETFRDSVMAENIGWLQNANLCSGPIFVFAHNDHIANSVTKDHIRLGKFLGRRFGDKYFAIGIDFLVGSFLSRQPIYAQGSTSRKLVDYSSPGACVFSEYDSVSLAFSFTHGEDKIVYVNVRDGRKNFDFSRLPFFKTGKFHQVGASFEPHKLEVNSNSYYEKVNLTENFDGLILFKESTPTHFLNSGKLVQ